MELFGKNEPDMKCWNCDKLISHKKVKWKPRTFTNESLITGEKQDELRKTVEQLAELTNELDKKSKIALEKGIIVNKQLQKPLEVSLGSNTKRILIVLDEGKKREIRLMFENIDYEVKKLTRIKIGNLDLSNLKIGLGKTLKVTKEFILENLGLPE